MRNPPKLGAVWLKATGENAGGLNNYLLTPRTCSHTFSHTHTFNNFSDSDFTLFQHFVVLLSFSKTLAKLLLHSIMAILTFRLTV